MKDFIRYIKLFRYGVTFKMSIFMSVFTLVFGLLILASSSWKLSDDFSGFPAIFLCYPALMLVNPSNSFYLSKLIMSSDLRRRSEIFYTPIASALCSLVVLAFIGITGTLIVHSDPQSESGIAATIILFALFSGFTLIMSRTAAKIKIFSYFIVVTAALILLKYEWDSIGITSCSFGTSMLFAAVCIPVSCSAAILVNRLIYRRSHAEWVKKWAVMNSGEGGF